MKLSRKGRPISGSISSVRLDIFQRTRVTVRDQRIFIAKLILAATLITSGAVLTFFDSLTLSIVGMVVLGFMYTHCVELQHQCLHHSAFVRPSSHRYVGFLLGLPLLVCYSHYRVRHLQHHKYLGTENDSEFFGFDPRAPLTKRMMLRGLFDYGRLLSVVKDIYHCMRGDWRYTEGQISDRRRRDVVREHLLMGIIIATAGVLCVLGFWEPIVKLWLIPLLIAVPLHFLVEIPEHILCDVDSTDVLRNTRSVTASRISAWFTNGNNFHVEHHAAMTVPMHNLRERHTEVRRRALHVSRGYPQFYGLLFAAMRKGKRKGSVG
ncbi:stearoyl-CoA 9-desaturase [Streptomyces sp. WAC 05977]|nr:stearoyl-CoA 9-desaturase [Streptomyces sp. WAC 05977]